MRCLSSTCLRRMPLRLGRMLLLLSVIGISVMDGGFAANLNSASSGGTPFGLPGGTFEVPALPVSPGYVYNATGSGWSLTGGAGLSRNGTGFTSGNPNAPEGIQVLFLQGVATAAQNINFPAGYYTFNFYAAQRANFPSTQTFLLRVDGVVIQTFTPSGYTYQTYASPPVLLSSGSHLIELHSTNPLGTDNTAFVDDFKATRIKEQAISGFESPAIPTVPGYVYSPTGGPWTFGTGSGLSRNSSGFTAGNPNAPEGSQVCFLQGGSTASISITIPRTAHYRFRFKAAIRGNNPTQPAAKNVRITVAGIEVGEFALTSTTYTEQVSLAIHLTAGSHTLSLTGVNPLPGDHTGFVDDLRMEMLHDWQDAYVWGGSGVPGSMDMATVSMGSAVCIHGNVIPESIEVMGELLGVQNQNVTVTTKNIMVMGMGSLLELGQDLAPFPGSATFTLNATKLDPDVMGMGNKFIAGMDEATLHFHGLEKVSWTQLGANVNAGSTSITLKEAVNWQIGDEIVVVSSRPNWNEAEQRTISGISGGGTVITLDTSLVYPHKGVVKTYTDGTRTWTADLRAQVGLLTHNIKIQGDAASETDGFGGHMMVMTDSKAYISGIELYNMGQKALLKRYPFHWHMLGDVGEGQYFKNSSVHQSYNRAITIHGTWSTLVENNFFYDHIGHGVFLEDGSEIYNVIRRNVTLLTKRPAQGEAVTPSDNQFDQPQNRTPSSYWITNPENTFEDNVAAGTQGTGFWFALPVHPMGPSATDPRFSSMLPFTHPMISFKGNSAHSCMTGFDIFDQLDASHAIVPNAGWAENSTHLMENCTWYANDQALYTGIGAGGPSDNLIFYNNVFVENLVGTMFASYSVVDQSVNVANSGENLLGGTRYAYRVYDGAGQVRNTHFIGWDTTNANFFMNTGAGIKHTNHLFTGNSLSHTGTPRIVLENFDIKPDTGTHANHPGHPRYWSITVRDVTGTISGKANTTIVSNHPFLLVGDEFRPSNWTRCYRSDHRFVLSRLAYGVPFEQTPDIVCTREKAGTATEPVYYVDGYKEWHQLPFLVNEGYLYTYQYKTLPTVKSVQMNMEDATAGDWYIARFKDFGKLGGISFSSSQGSFPSHASLASLQGAGSSGYYLQANGDLYIKAVATAKNQWFNINWTTNFTVPVIDTDGDQMADATEITGGRHPFDAGDLAAEFNTASGFEGWTGSANITSPTVSGGVLTGTSSNNGDAQLVNNEYNFSADRVPHLFVRIRASSATGVQIFFATSTLPGFSATRVVSATYSGTGGYETLQFDMNGHTDWANTITDLRLDPVSGLGISFAIDWIRAGCQGVDTDGDGVCDFQDICPTLDDHLIGTSCNDGNPATFPDAWSASCVCTTGSFKAFAFDPASLLQNESVIVYPNPFLDQLHIELREAGRFHTVRLLDVQGRVIREAHLEQDMEYMDWDLQDSPLTSGIYFVAFLGEGQRSQMKLVKQ